MYVNGRRVSGVLDLQHEDRIVLAPNHVYLYNAPPARRTASTRTIDFDFVQREIAAAQAGSAWRS